MIKLNGLFINPSSSTFIWLDYKTTFLITKHLGIICNNLWQEFRFIILSLPFIIFRTINKRIILNRMSMEIKISQNTTTTAITTISIVIIATI